MAPVSRRDLLVGTAAAGTLAALGAGAGPATAALGLGSPAAAPIDHVVVVMMENRSFDHVLGWLPGSGSQQEGLTYLDGDGQAHATRRWAPDYKGCGFADPGHSWKQGRVQLGQDRLAQGFIKPGSGNDDFALGYYTAEDVPVWADLAQNATIFKHYHCSVLGPTYPNREYMHAASSGGRKTNATPATPQGAPDPNGFPETTIWERCEEQGVSWAYYYSNIPVLALYGRLVTRHPDKVRHISRYYADAALGLLPQVAFVDPFFVAPEGLANDDHPHADIRLGQQFLADVVGAFQSSPCFRRGALFINYDEWGGFFDTRIPGRAADERASASFDDDFGQLGFRTPAAVISPYAVRGAIAPGSYDHTSILRFIEWRFGLKPLSRRDAAARNIGEVLDFTRFDGGEVVRDYQAPPDARIPCAAEEAFEGSDLMVLQTSGLTDALGLRTDWPFAWSYRTF